MRKLTDEDLQILVVDKGSAEKDDEIQLYEAVYQGLNLPLELSTESFAADLVEIIERKIERQSLIKHYFAIAIVIITGVTLLIIGTAILDRHILSELTLLLDKHILSFLLALMLFLAIEFLNKINLIKQGKSYRH